VFQHILKCCVAAPVRRYGLSAPAVAPATIAVAACEDTTVAVHDAVLNPGNTLVRPRELSAWPLLPLALHHDTA